MGTNFPFSSFRLTLDSATVSIDYTLFYKNNFIRTMRLRLAEIKNNLSKKLRLWMKKVKMFLVEHLLNFFKSLHGQQKIDLCSPVGEDCERGQ